MEVALMAAVGGLIFIKSFKSLFKILPYFYDTKTWIYPQEKAKKYILIAGATDGIGKAFSQKLALYNYNLILLGRNIEKLEDTKLLL